MSFVTWVKARVIWPTLLADVAAMNERLKLAEQKIAELEAATSTKDLPEL